MEQAGIQLTGKEQHFCEEYILDYNGTASAIRAGYPEKSAAKRASQLLKRTEIRTYIRQLQKERRDRLCVEGDFVMAETLDLLRKCKADVPVMAWDYGEHKMVETGEYQVDSKGATKCLELLAKMVGFGEEKNAGKPVVYITDDLMDGGDDDE